MSTERQELQAEKDVARLKEKRRKLARLLAPSWNDLTPSAQQFYVRICPELLEIVGSSEEKA